MLNLNLEFPDSNLDGAHETGKSYFNRIKKVKCKSIVCLNTFCHRTLLYRAKNDIKQNNGYKIRLDLRKRRYLMLSKANKVASDDQNTNFCYADVNFRLFRSNCKDFFDTLEDLRDLLNRKC